MGTQSGFRRPSVFSVRSRLPEVPQMPMPLEMHWDWIYMSPSVPSHREMKGGSRWDRWQKVVISEWACINLLFQFSSVQFSRSVVSDSLRLHESQPARPPCPSPTPRVHSDSRRYVWTWANSGRWWGQGGLACCSPWGLKKLDTTGWLNSNNKC